jgi:hypothetical protein
MLARRKTGRLTTSWRTGGLVGAEDEGASSL